jgi:hypothetical protein
MNKIIIQLQKENEKTISKYMNQPNIKYYPQLFNMKSIIKKNLENDLPIKDDDKNNDFKDKNPTYHPGGIKTNRIKCYKEMNHDLLKAEERKKQEQLEEEKKKRNKYIAPKLLEQYFKRNRQELLDNILKLNEKLLTPINDNESEDKLSVTKDKNEKNNNLPVNIKQLYLFGTNFSCDENRGNNFFVYHKKDRWICYPHSDWVVVDQYIDDIASNIDLKKNQIVLNKHKNKGYINSIKISPNGSVIYFKNEEKYITFYNYDYQKKKFDFISEMKINYNSKINDYIVDQNNMFCIVLYDNYNLLILDFISKEEVIEATIDYLEQNNFSGMILNNYTEYKIEFCFYSNNSYKIYNLQYLNEIKIIETKMSMNFEEKEINSIDFLPSFGYTATLCLLIAFEDKSLYLINSDYNQIVYKYKFEFSVDKIISTLFYINFISGSDIIFYKIPNLKNISIDDIKYGQYNLLNEKNKKVIKHESKILCSDIDLYDSEGSALICTERGLLYYDFYPERKKIKLYGFNSEEKYINNCVIINNYNNDINEIKKVSHYIVTSHNRGTIKVVGLPSFDIIYEFREKNDEISYLLGIPGKSLFLVFYKSGMMKCFDIHKCKFTGIINVIDIIGKYSDTNDKYNNNYIKYATFYPGGRFCLAVDAMKNSLYLFTIDQTDSLFVKCKQIPYIQINELVNIYINKIEPFHTFAITNNYNEIFVYDRKYASLIKTLNLENDTPVYQKRDYFNINSLNLKEYEIVDNSVNNLLDVDKINQNECYYGLKNINRERERHYLYIFNYRLNSLILRDTKAKTIIDAIQLNRPIYSFLFQKSLQNYIIYMDKKEIKKYNIDDLTYNKNIYKGIENLPSMKKYYKEHKLIISDDEKIIIFTNNSCYNIYLIVE